MSYTSGANTSSTARRRVTVLGDGTLRKNQNCVADLTQRLTDFGANQPQPFTVSKLEERQNSVIYGINGAHFSMDLVRSLDEEFPGAVYSSSTQTLQIPIDATYFPSSSLAAKTEAAVSVVGGLVLVACAAALSWTG